MKLVTECVLIIPVNLALVERSFLTMKLTKKYLRKSMAIKILHNLSLISIKREYNRSKLLKDRIKKIKE
jgi:hypothetical protein